MWQTYISLTAHKDKDKFWDANTITIAIHDDDDFDLGMLYKVNPDDFINVLHELHKLLLICTKIKSDSVQYVENVQIN